MAMEVLATMDMADQHMMDTVGLVMTDLAVLAMMVLEGLWTIVSEDQHMMDMVGLVMTDLEDQLMMGMVDLAMMVLEDPVMMGIAVEITVLIFVVNVKNERVSS